MQNSIMEALSHPTGTREQLARNLVGICRDQARDCYVRAEELYNGDKPLSAVQAYGQALEWEEKAARILQSIVFQREPEFSRDERMALLRLISG